ncbi:class I SAM-dependent methyltransferase [candidate division KSB1 bacterium]|nr:class I SAM-dependent methyltransferase [candidate division KSB1 bacterium]
MIQNHFAEKIQSYYSKNTNLVSSPFSNLEQINSDLYNRVFSQLDIEIKNKQILDVGCGGGLFSHYCKKQGADYTGLDITFENLRRASSNGYGVYLQADSQKLPFPEQCFELISVIDSFEHFPNPYEAADEFKRILKPDGVIFLSVPNYFNVGGLVKKILENVGGWDPDSWAPFDQWEPQVYEHFFTPGKIKRLFKVAGFSNFRLVSLPENYYVGTLPWVWHPKCPGKVARLVEIAQRPFGRIFSQLMPWFGLHNIWRIS